MKISQRQAKEREEKISYWQPHMDAWQADRTTATAYCRKHGLSIHRFKYWQYRLVPSKKVNSIVNDNLFTEIKLAESKSDLPIINQVVSDCIEIKTPLGYQIFLPLHCCGTVLIEVLQSLRKVSC